MAEKSKVLRLIDICGKDVRRYSVTDMLRDTAADVERGESCHKAIVLLLYDEGSSYEVYYNAAGLTRPEIVALLDAAKLAALQKLIGDQEI